MTLPARRVHQLLDRYKTVFAAHHPGAVAALHATDGTFCVHDGSGTVHGRERIAERFEALFAMWPALEVRPRRELVGDGFWVLDWTLSVPLTGRTITLDRLDLVTVDDAGLVRTKDTWIDADQYAALLASIEVRR